MQLITSILIRGRQEGWGGDVMVEAEVIVMVEAEVIVMLLLERP